MGVGKGRKAVALGCSRQGGANSLTKIFYD